MYQSPRSNFSSFRRFMCERLFRFRSQSFAHFDLSFLFPHFLTLKLMLPQYKSEAAQTTYSSTAKPQLREKRTVRKNVCVRHGVPSYLPFWKCIGKTDTIADRVWRPLHSARLLYDSRWKSSGFDEYDVTDKYSPQTTKKSTLFSGQYLRNHWTLDIGVVGYIGIVWPKEHSPEVWSVPPVTPCIYTVYH